MSSPEDVPFPSAPPSRPAAPWDLLRSGRRTVMYLPGGGITGALYQLGVLAALEDEVAGFRANDLHGYLAVGSGAVLAAAFAGGLHVQRLYRALLDPADVFFPLERRHVLALDVGEWRRTASAVFGALRRAAVSLTQRPDEPYQEDPWTELDRFQDVLPAGLFSLEPLERFLEAFFERRGIEPTFSTMTKPLVVPAHDLDTGELVPFGLPGWDRVRVARAICASMALPLFFAPVRIGDRVYFTGTAGNSSSLDLAVDKLGAEVVLIVNPLVPVAPGVAQRVPTGYGAGRGVRDKGLLWVYNQALRISERAQLAAEVALLQVRRPNVDVLLVQPESVETVRFMDSPMKYSARRTILEESYKSTRARLRLRSAPG